MLQLLLLQVRNADDPIRHHEVECFAHGLEVEPSQITVRSLLPWDTERIELESFDAVLVGGSGDYSVVEGGSWLPSALEIFRSLYEHSIPTFASCWGFQAFAKALGGHVVTDLQRAEVGTFELKLSEEAQSDPVFGIFQNSFSAQIGHQDIVERLPEDAILLCSSDQVVNHAMTFPGKPIYATQFHPELTKEDLVTRLTQYSEYVYRITGLDMETFVQRCYDTPETFQLLRRFKKLIN